MIFLLRNWNQNFIIWVKKKISFFQSHVSRSRILVGLCPPPLGVVFPEIQIQAAWNKRPKRSRAQVWLAPCAWNAPASDLPTPFWHSPTTNLIEIHPLLKSKSGFCSTNCQDLSASRSCTQILSLERRDESAPLPKHFICSTLSLLWHKSIFWVLRNYTPTRWRIITQEMDLYQDTQFVIHNVKLCPSKPLRRPSTQLEKVLLPPGTGFLRRNFPNIEEEFS